MRITEYVDRDQTIAEMASGRSVLHLGCASSPEDMNFEARARHSLHGELTRIADVVGVDIDVDAVNAYRNRGLFNNIIAGDIEKLAAVPLPLKDYNLVLLADVVEHLSNPGLAFDGIRELLSSANEGILVVTTPNAFGLLNFLRYVVGRFREAPDHVSVFNVEGLTQLLVKHGFVVVEAKTCHQRLARHRRFFKLGRLLFRRFPHLGGTLFLVAHPR